MCLTCNVKMSFTTAKLSEKSRTKHRSNRFQNVSSLSSPHLGLTGIVTIFNEQGRQFIFSNLGKPIGQEVTINILGKKLF